MRIQISVIVPCYNQGIFLNEALQSVFDQTYFDWECIIVNDGSTDNTQEIAELWVKKDRRFSCITQLNSGLCAARNAGIEKAIGVYILPLDADDKIGRDYLQLAMQAFEKEPSLKLVYCKAEKFGFESGSWILEDFSLKALATENMIFCSAVYKKEDWLAIGGYDKNMKFGLEDWEFWISLLKNGGRLLCLEYIGFFYQVKPISMVKLLDQEKRKYLFNYLSVKHADFFVNQLGSFQQLIMDRDRSEANFYAKTKSRKFIVDFITVTFFSFSIFKKYKK